MKPIYFFFSDVYGGIWANPNFHQINFAGAFRKIRAHSLRSTTGRYRSWPFGHRNHAGKNSQPPLLFAIFPKITPWKINGWNLQITHLERKMIWTKPPLLCSMLIFRGVISYSPRSWTCRPWKMVGKENDPFLLGFDNFSGANKLREAIPWPFLGACVSWKKRSTISPLQRVKMSWSLWKKKTEKTTPNNSCFFIKIPFKAS